MKRTFTFKSLVFVRLVLLVGLLTGINTSMLQAQISGVKNIPGDYADLAAAITDLNTVGVGAGGVTLNLLAGNPQTTPAGGYSITTLTSDVTKPIVLQGNGNTITASAAHVVGSLHDAIFEVIGTDYVTIQGFVMQENAANTVTAAATNNMTEWGVAVLYASTTNGAQNCTIQSNTISLNRTYQNTFAVYSNSTHSATAPTTSATATGATGGNHNLVVRSNTISNVNNGIVVIGPTAAADQNINPIIGGNAAGDGNTISDFGNTGTFSGYANVSGTVYGILMRNSTNYNISRNSITSSNGGTTAGTLRGIYVVGYSVAPTGTLTHTISNNTISLTHGNATATLQGITVESSTNTNTSTQNITNNNITKLTYTPAGSSGTVTAISTVVVVASLNVSNNTFTNLSVNTTGSFTFVAHSYTMPAGASQTFSDNSVVTGFTKTGAGGTITGFTSGASSATGSFSTMTNNNLSNLTASGATTMIGISNTDGSGSSPSRTVTGNIFNNWTGGTSAMTGISFSYIGSPSSTISNNTITNFNGQGAISGLVINNTFAGANPLTIENNTINNLKSTGTGGAVVGITCSNASTVVNINGNTVHTLNSTGASAVSGISVTGGTATNVFKNKIYGLSGTNASSTVNGILVSAGTTVNVYNNLIGDLQTPVANAANPLNGLNITGGTTINAYYNTIYLAASSTGALFGSSAISASTTPTLTLRNNIFVNNSKANGAAFTAAYRRSTTTLTSYAAASNNNLFFANAPCASSVIFYDGTNSDQTLAAYKVRVAARDAASVTEDPQFISTAGSSANFLHINTSIATQIESGATSVAGITDDFDGNLRNGTTPDIGADEFTGTVAAACAGTPVAGTATASSANICTNQSATICLSGQSAAAGIRVQWQSSNTPGGPYVDIACAGANCYNTGLLPAGTYYFVAKVICDNSGLSATSNEVTITVNGNPTVAVTPNSTNLCNGSSVTLTASGANTYSWAPATGLNTNMGAVVIASPTVNTVYTVTGTDVIGCSATATASITIVQSPSISASATPAAICIGGNSQLQATNLGNSNANNYTFSSGSGAALDPMAGSTIVIGSSVDDTPTASPAAIGFTFPYEGVNYTQYSVSPDGWILLGGATAVSDFSNQVTDPTNVPKIYPYWDDLATGTDGNVKVLVSGSAPNRIFMVQWFVTIPRNTTGAANSTFQAWLYEGTGKIEFRYGGMGIPTSASISGGITGVTPTNFNSLTYSTNTSSSSTANDANAVAPANTTIYTYNPPTLTFAWTPTTFLNNPNIANPLASGVAQATTYTVTATANNGCTTTASVTVTVDPVAFTVTGGGAYCAGDDGVPVGLSGSQAGISYQLRKDGNDFGAPVIGTGAALDFGLQGPGTYTVFATNTNSGCSGAMIGSVVVTEEALPTAFNVTGGGSFCEGGAGVLVGLSGSQVNVSYALFEDGNFVSTIQGSGAAISFGLQTEPGVYTVQATNNTQNECGNEMTGSVTVTVNPLPVLSETHNDPADCFSNDGSIDLTVQGNDPFSYNWTSPNGSGLVNGQQDQSGLSTGTFNVVVTNTATGCTSELSITLDVQGGCGGCNSITSVTVDPTPICSGGTTTFTAVGALPGAILDWYDAPTGGNLVGSGNPLVSGPLNVTTTYCVEQTVIINQNVSFDYTGDVQTFTVPAGVTEITIEAYGAAGADGTGGNAPGLGGNGGFATGTLSVTPGDVINIYVGGENGYNGGGPAGVHTGNGFQTFAGNGGGASDIRTGGNALSNRVLVAAGGGGGGGSNAGSCDDGNPSNGGVGGGNNGTNGENGTGCGPLGVGGGGGGADQFNGGFGGTAGTNCNNPGDPGDPGMTGLAGMGGDGANNGCSQVYQGGPGGGGGGGYYGGGGGGSGAGGGGGNFSGGGGGGGSSYIGGVTNGSTTSGVQDGNGLVILYFTGPCVSDRVCGTVTVNPTPVATATPAAQTICSGSNITTIALTSNVPNTTFGWTRDNTVSVTGIAASGSGDISGALVNTTNAPVTVTFTITPATPNCTGAPITATVVVNPTPNATATPAAQTICSGNTITTIVLAGNVNGTTYNWTRDNVATVTGIAANGSGNISGALTNTTNAPITVTFTITPTANNCPGAPITATVLVNPTPNAVATPAAQTICSGNTITTIVLSGNVNGTVYNWTRNNVASVTGIAANGAGNISGALTNTTNAPITVTFTITPTANNCPGAPITATVLVNPVPAAFQVTGGGVICNTDNVGVPVGLSGSQTNVNYQLRLNNVNTGAPVAGTGAAITFGPQIGIGTYTVVATHVQGACTANMTGQVTIAGFNCSVAISDPCVCKNNATTLTNGQFDETIKVNAPDGQVWTVSAVNGLFNQFSPVPPSNPFPIALGTNLIVLGGNMYQLKGIHVDAIGYTVTVTNGRGTSLTIGNSCQYPNPSITTNFPPEICLFSDPIPLTGNPGDANIVSATFLVNGVPTNTFNPAQGVGAYNIVYSVNGGAPKAFGPNDPGCIQNVSTVVNVVATPTNLVCNDQVYVSLEAACTKEVFPDDVLEGTYLCFDDYFVEVDKTIPYGNGPWIPAVFNAGDIGKNYQVRVTHKVSNNKCWGNLKVEDKLSPVLTCEPFSIPCNTPIVTPGYLVSNLGISAAQPTATDCQSVTWTYLDSNVPQNCATGLTSIIERKWTATDASGNTATCIQQISLIRPTLGDVVAPPDYDDINAPSFSCEDNIPVENGHPHPTPDWIESQGLQGYPYVFGEPSGCSLNWEWHDYIIEVCDGTVKYRREWTIIDWCIGDGFIVNQIIKVLDESGPDFDCPANLTVSTDPFTCCVTFNLPDVIVEDNCSRINNISGMITVRDAETNEIVNMVPISGSLQDFPGNNYWDLDTLANFGFTPCLPAGSHQVTYVVEDDCGNTSSCQFNLTVRDYIPPVASCDETTTVAIGTDDAFDCYGPAGPNNSPAALDACSFGGVTWVKATAFNDGSYDQCNNVKFTVRRMSPYSDCILALNSVRGEAPCDATTPSFPSEFERAISEQDSIKFYCCEVGTTQTIVLAVYQVDLNGNVMVGPDGSPIKNECMIQVEVQDKLKPTCVPPANVAVNCENFDPSLWAYGKAQVSDNCCLDVTKEYQGQCGLTHSVNYTLFDTVCNKGTITRTFRAFDCHGFSSQCTQRVFVTYEQDYFVKFPNDQIVTVCDGSGNYGEPLFFGEDCELLGVAYEDEVFTVVPDACFKIERTWTIINWCTFDPNGPCIEVPNPNPNPVTNAAANLPGPTVSACGTIAPWAPTSVRINPTDPQPTNFCTFYDKNANCYKYKQIIKVIDGQAPTGTYTVPDCSNQNWYTPNNSQLWNEMYWWDNGIQTHDLCEEPTDLCITGTDACSGSNINIEYLLFLDLDGDNVMETVVNSVNVGLAGLGWNNVLYNNLNTPNFAGGTPRQFDERPVPSNQKYGFSIQETVSGNNKTACVRWNTQQQQNNHVIPELPHGTHKIKWFITDGCGNNSEYEYTFTVKDCKAPTVVCLNGLSTNIMPTGMITLWASDFLQYTEDNCTPAGQLKIGIRKCGAGTGFPVDAQGNPITSVTFTCAELGNQCVELWSIDAAGNADYCETYVIVQDNQGNCGNGTTVTVSGALITEDGDGVEEAMISLFGTTQLTNSTGEFTAQAPIGSTFTIAPEKDDNPLNGVTTYDLVLISKHILGLEPLNSPYKMIAADANKSGSITTFDIVEIRKLILGIYTELPNNTSWRFVDKAYVFPTPSNPFQPWFPEVINVVDALTPQLDKDFVGVKIGDVNSSAVANALMQSEERNEGTALFDIEDRNVVAGEEFNVTFKSAQALKGFQFTATLAGLKAVGVVNAENVNESNFNLLPQNAMAVSIDGAQEFTVRFRAEQSGKLSEMLGVSGAITRAEAYGDAGRMGVAFRFRSPEGMTISSVGFELYQNQPNPFVNRTFIGFFLPEAAEATLSVFDETGRVVYQQKGQFAKGENMIALDRALINTTGMLYYKLETATDSATKKMIQAK